MEDPANARPPPRRTAAFLNSKQFLSRMSLSTLPLSYCTNVHAGRSVAEVEAGLDRYTVNVQRNLDFAMAAGLWLSAAVARELDSTADGVQRFGERLAGRGLTCHTLNAFPYGDFHGPTVKEGVYVPSWSEPDRLDYTLRCARILTALMPEGCEGSISTMPLGFKRLTYEADFQDRCIAQLLTLAAQLDELHDETGRVVRIAIEPEPLCLVETTEEAIKFFDALRRQASDRNMLSVVNRHLGLCYDVCHQAVEFEDVAESIAALRSAEIRINKVHVTCAIELQNPGKQSDKRQNLAKYVEPRYLHQTTAKLADGRVLRAVDLTPELALHPEGEFAAADAWRVHFHVPVDAEELGPLSTTRTDLRRALTAIAELEYAPHLEVETYTWEVLPGGPSADLVTGLTREMQATRKLLVELRRSEVR